MASKCPYAFRVRGDVSLHCLRLMETRYPQCGHQYFCPNTGRWEASPESNKCPIRKKSNETERN